VRKWKGQLLDVNLDKLRKDLDASRDFIFSKISIGNPPGAIPAGVACLASSKRIRIVTLVGGNGPPLLFCDAGWLRRIRTQFPRNRFMTGTRNARIVRCHNPVIPSQQR